ncbi:hypothetical protein [Amycolatopsis sp. RTGN1]|uniref:hypothetical protein n=1 Tax=Amycolatopsis ponsaeliensis TaxID=2992142 RepID=UPI00254CD4C1|nr:hypothetical protein [Amycolatopsis sp. RTGN1]
MTVPDREQVTRTWTELISGVITRADAHAWAVPWVEDETARVPDPRTRDALLHLHGFDQAYTGDGMVGHGVSTDWLHSEEDIATAFARWQTATTEYDKDPAGYASRARQRALEQLRQERPES